MELIKHRINLEISFINDLWDRHDNGDRHAKFLLVLYMREFELDAISRDYAEAVLSRIETPDDYDSYLNGKNRMKRRAKEHIDRLYIPKWKGE